MSLRTLAKILETSKSTVQRDVASRDEVLPDGTRIVSVGKVRGLDNKLRPSRRYDTTDRDDAIRERRQNGDSMRQIADVVGCSVGTVHRVLKSSAG